jgi:hypothetical protein
MADYPESFWKIVRDANKAHPSDITAARDQAKKKIRRLSDFAEWIDEMVDSEILSMVHDDRHRTNVGLRRAAGEFGGPAKVGLATGAAIAVASESLLESYSIAGRNLGSISGSELKAIADSESAIAGGHLFNVRLCRALMPLVAADKTVCECISEAKAKKIFQQVRGPAEQKRKRA